MIAVFFISLTPDSCSLLTVHFSLIKRFDHKKYRNTGYQHIGPDNKGIPGNFAVFFELSEFCSKESHQNEWYNDGRQNDVRDQ